LGKKTSNNNAVHSRWEKTRSIIIIYSLVGKTNTFNNNTVQSRWEKKPRSIIILYIRVGKKTRPIIILCSRVGKEKQVQ